MKFGGRAAIPALLTFLAFMPAARAQTTKKTVPAPAPKAAPAAAPRQSSAPARQSSAPARQSSAPARSAPSRQSSSTPRQSSGSSASRQTTSRQTSHQTTSRQTKSRAQSSSSQTESGSTPQTASQRRQAQAQQRQAQASQRKQQATQLKQQRQQQQQQRKEQARQAKEQQKQQRQKEKDQARQAKEQQKQERQKQKELARQQKGQKPVQNAASSAPKSPPSSTSNAPAAAKAPVYSAPSSSAIAGKTSTGATTLNRGGSQAVVQQVNASRSSMRGINQKPLPAGDVTVHPNGRLSINAAGGRQYGVRANGTVSSYHDSAKSVTFNGNGRVSSLHTADMDIHRSPAGQRTIVSHLANNTTVVSTGPHSGYVERNVVVGNRTYVQRTVVVNQRVTTRMYVGYPYGGIVLNRYVAPVYYAPGFYGWTYDAWGNPVPYGWGWMGDPWYAGPNPYFAAYPVYPGAAYWLTDYMIGQTLSAAYQAQADAALDSNDGEYSADASEPSADDSDTLAAVANTPVTPEIKNQIAAEVKQEISDDQAASAAPERETSNDEVASALSHPNYIFVVASNLDVITSEEQNCGLRPGDTLQLTSPAGSGATAVELRVASSKRQDCPAGVMVSVSVQDLQEMLNSFHAQVESGLETLQAKQGQDRLPAAPADALAAPRKAVADTAPADASGVTATLDAQRQQANQTEAQAAASAFGQ